MQSKNSPQQITEGVIWKQLLIFFFPILVGTLFQQLYNTVDTIIVGRFVGTHALAAVGASGSLISFINNFFLGLSSGATVVLAQFYGARDKQGVEDAVHTGITFAVLSGLAVTAIGLGAAMDLLHLMDTPETCIEDAALYTRLYFLGAVASMVYNMGSGILRAMGDSKRPMIFLIVSCGINIVMDLLCVVTLDMGVAGAAIATVLSQTVSAILVLVTLKKLPGEGRLRLRKLRLKGKLLGHILSVGVPAGLQFAMFDLSNLIVQSSINSFGDTVVAAWTAYGKTDALTWMISGAFGVAVTTFVGQNFGAQKYRRIRQSVWICLGMSVGAVGVLSVLLLRFREPILGIYTTDRAVIEAASQLMLQIVAFNAVFMPVEVFSGTMRGTGYSLIPTLITCSCVCVFRAIWVLLVVSRWHSIEMLALAYPISWILSASLFFITYLRGNWLRKRIAACNMEPEE